MIRTWALWNTGTNMKAHAIYRCTFTEFPPNILLFLTDRNLKGSNWNLEPIKIRCNELVITNMVVFLQFSIGYVVRCHIHNSVSGRYHVDGMRPWADKNTKVSNRNGYASRLRLIAPISVVAVNSALRRNANGSSDGRTKVCVWCVRN